MILLVAALLFESAIHLQPATTFSIMYTLHGGGPGSVGGGAVQ
ncbi:hypothetical protein [Streptococcus infantis]|nr:hypothetical protein [Streptococcus infantis]